MASLGLAGDLRAVEGGAARIGRRGPGRMAAQASSASALVAAAPGLAGADEPGRLLCGSSVDSIRTDIQAEVLQSEGGARMVEAELDLSVRISFGGLLAACSQVWESSCVKPRTRVRPWTSPDFS